MKNMNAKTLVSLLLAAVLVVGVGTFGLKAANGPRPMKTESTEQTGEHAGHTHDTATATSPTDSDTPKAKTASDISYDNASLPSEPLGERTLGDANAPVRIEEFSSLSCPHCAHFHRDTLATLKEKYIDTGKVFFVFTDFPLNAPALDAAMISRCMPPERYFKFIAYLYENQEKWAFQQNYKDVLRQDAKLAGMTDERFDSCLADTALKEGLVNRMQTKAEKHEVKSTPSFVINNKHVTTGALPIAAFDEMIAKAEQEAAAGKAE
jgi:protein-disulfide isomerase